MASRNGIPFFLYGTGSRRGGFRSLFAFWMGGVDAVGMSSRSFGLIIG